MSRRDPACQGNPLDPRIVHDLIRLVMGDQEIGIKTNGRSGFYPELLKGDGALGDNAGMFHDQDTACHKLGAGDPGELIVGEVPWFHAEDYPERAALHVCFAEGGMEFDRGEEAFGIFRVVSLKT